MQNIKNKSKKKEQQEINFPKRKLKNAELLSTPNTKKPKQVMDTSPKTSSGDETVVGVDNQDKFTVYTQNHDKLYELLLEHGVSVQICDLLQEKEFNGEDLKKLSAHKSKAELKAYLEKSILDKKLTELETRHFHAIVKRYELNPFPPKRKIICDAVHGQIEVHPLLIKIIDTTQFQRLRYLKQLGTLYFVYPSATHSRFEHSIGTSYLAGLLIKHLKENQPSLRITSADDLCVRIAGLCHDLGHGPFSHMFEEVVENLDSNYWKHEMATLKLFDKMLIENPELRIEFEVYGLFENDIQLIKDLIYAPSFKSPDANKAISYEEKLVQIESLRARGLEKSFLFEIISNYKNGIDVDKFDYFNRDCIQLGFTNNFNFQRYIACTRVIKVANKAKPELSLNQLCVRDKEIGNLYEMFHVRELLTRRAYKHETGSSINLMVVESLTKANSYFNFGKIFGNKNGLDLYEKLNDNIFFEILYSSDERLKESRELLERIVKRKLYKFVTSVVLKSTADLEEKDFEDGYEYFAKESNNEINRERVKLELVKFNYGSSNKNPLDDVLVYNKNANDVAFKINKDQVSYMLLNEFEDKVLRIYSRYTDPNFVHRTCKMFTKWIETKSDWCKNSPVYGAFSPEIVYN